MGLPRWCSGGVTICQCRSLQRGGLDPWLGRSPGVGNGNPLQCSCLADSHRQRSLVGDSPWGCKELDTTEWLSTGTYLQDRLNSGRWEIASLRLLCIWCPRYTIHRRNHGGMGSRVGHGREGGLPDEEGHVPRHPWPRVSPGRRECAHKHLCISEGSFCSLVCFSTFPCSLFPWIVELSISKLSQ